MPDTYNSRTEAFAADKAELVAVYAREGHGAADRRCAEIAAARGLDVGQRLTLADAVRRHMILTA